MAAGAVIADADGQVAPAWTRGRSLAELLAARWEPILAAAAARAERTAPGGAPVSSWP
jgi:hypothetical protein